MRAKQVGKLRFGSQGTSVGVSAPRHLARWARQESISGGTISLPTSRVQDDGAQTRPKAAGTLLEMGYMTEQAGLDPSGDACNMTQASW
jgi:hypothetical protein